MATLTVSLACAPYDRVQPLFDGRVKIADCIIDAHPMPADEAFSPLAQSDCPLVNPPK